MVDTVGFVNAVSGAPAYNGRMLRQLNAVGFAGATAARPLGARSGVRPGTSPTTVTATSTTWTCQPFGGLLDGQVAGEAGPYAFAFDAVATGAVTAANASNPRIDILYVDVDDPSEDASSVPAVTRKYLAGTVLSGGFLTATLPAGCMLIAQINVPKAGGGSPTVTWVAPYCAAAGGVVDFNTKAELDAWTAAAEGQQARVLGTGVVYVKTTTGWVSILSQPLILQGSLVVPAAAEAQITAWTVATGPSDWYSAGKVTPKVAGWYEVTISSRWDSSSSGTRLFRITKNSASTSDAVTGGTLEVPMAGALDARALNSRTTHVFCNGTTDWIGVLIYSSIGPIGAYPQLVVKAL